MIGMDANQMDVPDVPIAARFGDEAERKAHHDPVVFDDAGHLAELVEEDRMREGARRPAPPTIDDLHDEVVVAFLEGAGPHLGAYTSTTASDSIQNDAGRAIRRQRECDSRASVEFCRVRRHRVDGKWTPTSFGPGHAVPTHLFRIEAAAVEHPADGRPREVVCPKLEMDGNGLGLLIDDDDP